MDIRISCPGKKGKVYEVTVDKLKEIVEYACEKSVHVLITLPVNEEDIAFVNAPSLGIRVISCADPKMFGDAIIETDFDHIGHPEPANSKFGEISKMFGGYGIGDAPPPSVLDDWETYQDWVSFILS